MVVFWQIQLYLREVQWLLRLAKKACHIYVRASIWAYFQSLRKVYSTSSVNYAKSWPYEATMPSALTPLLHTLQNWKVAWWKHSGTVLNFRIWSINSQSADLGMSVTLTTMMNKVITWNLVINVLLNAGLQFLARVAGSKASGRQTFLMSQIVPHHDFK